MDCLAHLDALERKEEKVHEAPLECLDCLARRDQGEIQGCRACLVLGVSLDHLDSHSILMEAMEAMEEPTTERVPLRAANLEIQVREVPLDHREDEARRVLRVKTDQQEHLATEDHLVQLVARDPPAQAERKERGVLRVARGTPGGVAPPERRVTGDFRVLLDPKDRRDQLVQKARPASRERTERMEIQVTQETPDPQDLLDHWVHKVSKALLVILDPLDPRVPVERQESQVAKELGALPVTEGSLDREVHLDHLVAMV